MINAYELIECVKGMDDAARAEVIQALGLSDILLLHQMSRLQLVTGRQVSRTDGLKAIGLDFKREQQRLLAEQEYIADQQTKTAQAPKHDIFERHRAGCDAFRDGIERCRAVCAEPGFGVDVSKANRHLVAIARAPASLLAGYFAELVRYDWCLAQMVLQRLYENYNTGSTTMTQPEHPGEKVDMSRHQRPATLGPQERKRIDADYRLAFGKEPPTCPADADVEAHYRGLEERIRSDTTTPRLVGPDGGKGKP